ncbi:hypothetical protein HII31_09346 [Pseudocercospora fuligena]|uniref:NDT80 domain-containing protein n=1 Tax=Pseudocercospora fuligena TaxID=685502 RepID=A0A8H6RE89_9PEZI|nr:hypothetical protein HII31_09346 [Pseudocercospora fuligena]
MGSSVLTMEQGPILQHQLPLDHYSLPSDHDNYEQYSGHAHHSAYTAGGAVDHIRRDGTAPLQQPQPFTFPSTNSATGTRFVTDRAVASEASSYRASNNFTDSSSGSISTSPSSAAGSLAAAYTNYPLHNQCTTLASYSGAVQQPQSFVPAIYNTRVPSILDSTASGMLPPPNPGIRSPISSSTHATDRDPLASSTPFLARTQLSPGSQPGYASFQDTPRTSYGLSNLSLSNQYPHSHMASPTYGNQQNDCTNFPWPNLEVQAEMTCEGQSVTPEVHAKVEKGFFLSTVDQKWTCYRRNYFSVQCHFELHPNINNGRMHLKRNNNQHTEQIQAMGMRLSAAVDGSTGKLIELIQHTPKRDNGPKTKIEIVKVPPTPSTGRNDHTVSPHGIYSVPIQAFHATGQVPGPFLPFQHSSDGSSTTATTQASSMTSHYGYSAAAGGHMPTPGQNPAHTFERVQFKQATANNGKRRASQQYFHLIVELYADVRKEQNDAPQWVKVAHRVSEKIVVRGRSPSHYQNEGQNQNGRTGSSSGGSGHSYAATTTFGNISSGGFRYGSGASGTALGGGTYRTNAYGYHPSPQHSGSSASSVDGGAENDYPADSVMSDAERSDIQAHEGYRYYPAPLYEGQGLPLPKIESTARYSTEPSSWAVKYENSDTVPGAQQWPMSRFQGVDSSRGYFPQDLTTTYP